MQASGNFHTTREQCPCDLDASPQRAEARPPLGLICRGSWRRATDAWYRVYERAKNPLSNRYPASARCPR